MMAAGRNLDAPNKAGFMPPMKKPATVKTSLPADLPLFFPIVSPVNILERDTREAREVFEIIKIRA